MTKSKKSKQRAAAAKAATQLLSQQLVPAAGGALQRLAKEKSKKSKGSFWSIVGGAAKMATELAPIVAPLFLAQHGPTMAAAKLASPEQLATAAAGVPLAANSCATTLGMYGLKTKKGRDGRVVGITATGMDALGQLSVNAQDVGQVLSEIDLNPFSSAWNNTMLQRQASLFERYRPKRVVCMVQPACPATTQGQIISYVDPDADDVLESAAEAAVQEASAHEGAEISQTWALNCCSLAFDESTQDYYADADGSDQRLLSPGKWRVLACSAMPATTVIGVLYVIWEYEFRIPQIENSLSVGPYASLVGTTGQTAALPLGTGEWDDLVNGAATFEGAYDEGTGKLYNFPAGLYFAIAYVEATGDGPQNTLVGDGVIFRDGVTGDASINVWQSNDAQGTNDTVTVYLFQVTQRVNDPTGFLLWTNSDAPDAGGARLTLIALPTAVSSAMPSRKRMTLQDYERQMLNMRKDIFEMREMMLRDRGLDANHKMHTDLLNKRLRDKREGSPTAAAAAKL